MVTNMSTDVFATAKVGYAYRNLGLGWGEALLGLGFLAKPPRSDGRGALGGHYSAVLVLSGRGRYADDRGHTWDLAPGRIFQRFVGRSHDLEVLAGEPWLECWVALGGPLAQGLASYGLMRPDEPVLECGLDRAWVTALARQTERLRSAEEAELPRFLPVLVDLLVRLLTAARTRTSGPDLVGYACRRLNEDPRLDLRVLARESGLSYERFRKVFTAATGEAPGAYRIRQRIDRARTLLLDPQAQVAAVAEALGYPSAFAFSAQFRAVVGVPPSQWRDQQG